MGHLYKRSFRHKVGHLLEMGGGRVIRRNRCCGRGCCWGFTRRLLRHVVNPVVRSIPDVEFRIRPAGRRDPHRPRPDLHYALRSDGAAAGAAGDHHQGRLHAANRPSHHGLTARPPVLAASAADLRAQSGPCRPSASAEVGPPRQRQQTGLSAGAKWGFRPLVTEAGVRRSGSGRSVLSIPVLAPASATETIRARFTEPRIGSHQSISGCRFISRVRLRIMHRPGQQLSTLGQAAQPHCSDDGQQHAERQPYQQAGGEHYASPFGLWVAVGGSGRWWVVVLFTWRQNMSRFA